MGLKVGNPAFEAAGIKRWRRAKGRGWMGVKGSGQDTGIIVSDTGEVQRGAKKFLNRGVFFHGFYPILGTKEPISWNLENPHYYELLSYLPELAGPLLSITPFASCKEVDLRSHKIYAVHDESHFLFGDRDYVGNAFVDIPSGFLPENVLDAISPFGFSNVTFRISEGFKKDQAKYPYGYMVNGMRMFMGQLPTESGNQLVGQIVLYPGKVQQL